MSTPANPISSIPTADQVLLPASNDVEIDGVALPLMQYAVELAYIHWLLFGQPLIVTSGMDNQHPGWSFHSLGRALDLRTRDLSADEQLVFLTVVMYSAPANKIAVFDLRQVESGHVLHLEWRG